MSESLSSLFLFWTTFYGVLQKNYFWKLLLLCSGISMKDGIWSSTISETLFETSIFSRSVSSKTLVFLGRTDVFSVVEMLIPALFKLHNLTLYRFGEYDCPVLKVMALVISDSDSFLYFLNKLIKNLCLSFKFGSIMVFAINPHFESELPCGENCTANRDKREEFLRGYPNIGLFIRHLSNVAVKFF